MFSLLYPCRYRPIFCHLLGSKNIASRTARRALYRFPMRISMFSILAAFERVAVHDASGSEAHVLEELMSATELLTPDARRKVIRLEWLHRGSFPLTGCKPPQADFASAAGRDLRSLTRACRDGEAETTRGVPPPP